MSSIRSRLAQLIAVLAMAAAVAACNRAEPTPPSTLATLGYWDFVDDPTLRARPHQIVIVPRLEPNEPIAIPYTFPTTADYRFCWHDDDGEIHESDLVADGTHGTVFSIHSGNACESRVIAAGDYTLHLRHDPRGHQGFNRDTIFVRFDLEATSLAEARDTVPALATNRCIGCVFNGVPGGRHRGEASLPLPPGGGQPVARPTIGFDPRVAPLCSTADARAQKCNDGLPWYGYPTPMNIPFTAGTQLYSSLFVSSPMRGATGLAPASNAVFQGVNLEFAEFWCHDGMPPITFNGAIFAGSNLTLLSFVSSYDNSERLTVPAGYCSLANVWFIKNKYTADNGYSHVIATDSGWAMSNIGWDAEPLQNMTDDWGLGGIIGWGGGAAAVMEHDFTLNNSDDHWCDHLGARWSDWSTVVDYSGSTLGYYCAIGRNGPRVLAGATIVGMKHDWFAAANLTGLNMAGATLEWDGTPDISNTKVSNSLLDGLNFSGASGANAAFASVTLANAVFDHAQLSSMACSDCDLRGASFRYADLTGATLATPSADLFVGAHFDHATLANATLNHVDLRNAVMENANATHATLTYANVGGLEGTYMTLDQAILSNSTANAGDANPVFDMSSMLQTTVENVVLPAASFTYVYASGSSWKGATLIRANFANATLDNSFFNGATLRSVNLAGANLSYSDLTAADLSMDSAKVRSNLVSTVGCGANLSGTNLSGANLTNAVFPQRPPDAPPGSTGLVIQGAGGSSWTCEWVSGTPIVTADTICPDSSNPVLTSGALACPVASWNSAAPPSPCCVPAKHHACPPTYAAGSPCQTNCDCRSRSCGASTHTCHASP